MSPSNPRVAVVGGAGVTGGELCRLLLGHPAAPEILPTSRGTDPLERVHPNLLGSGLDFCTVEEVLDQAGRLDAVFIAAPAGEAMRLSPTLLDAGARVIDLGADFRFPEPAVYSAVYGRPHTAPELLSAAVYGLTEHHRDAIGTARLVAGPGCFAITAILALAPLLRAGLIDTASPVHIGGVNGTTGAGGAPRAEVQHHAAAQTMLNYALAGHRHAPEIEHQLAAVAGADVTVALTTAHAPIPRGISLTITAPLREHTTTRDDLLAAYRDAYAQEYFVRVNDQDARGKATDKDYRRYPSVGSVAGSNFCHLGADTDPVRALANVVAVCDNLGKGAAGSAIQNMNVMLGLDETAGLRTYGL